MLLKLCCYITIVAAFAHGMSRISPRITAVLYVSSIFTAYENCIQSADGMPVEAELYMPSKLDHHHLLRLLVSPMPTPCRLTSSMNYVTAIVAVPFPVPNYVTASQQMLQRQHFKWCIGQLWGFCFCHRLFSSVACSWNDSNSFYIKIDDNCVGLLQPLVHECAASWSLLHVLLSCHSQTAPQAEREPSQGVSNVLYMQNDHESHVALARN